MPEKSDVKTAAHGLVAQMENLLEVYNYASRYATERGLGGIFIKSVSNVFNDKDYVSSNTFKEIMFKVKEYTKREAVRC